MSILVYCMISVQCEMVRAREVVDGRRVRVEKQICASEKSCPTETFADLDACKVRASIVLDNRGGPGSMRYILTNCEDSNDE